MASEEQKLTQALGAASDRMSSLTEGLQRAFGPVSDLTKTLAQSNQLNFGFGSFVDRIGKSNLSVSQNVSNFGSLVSQGLGHQAEELASMTESLSLLGVNVAGAARLTRLNTQALGLSVKESAALTMATIENAVSYGVGVDAMVGAMNSLASTFKTTSVLFGKNTGVELTKATQDLLGLVGQEFSGEVQQFIQGITNGVEGGIRRKFLGIGDALNSSDLIDGLNKLNSVITATDPLARAAQMKAFGDSLGITEGMFALADAIQTPKVKTEADLIAAEQALLQKDLLASINRLTNQVITAAVPTLIKISGFVEKNIGLLGSLVKLFAFSKISVSLLSMGNKLSAGLNNLLRVDSQNRSVHARAHRMHMTRTIQHLKMLIAATRGAGVRGTAAMGVNAVAGVAPRAGILGTAMTLAKFAARAVPVVGAGLMTYEVMKLFFSKNEDASKGTTKVVQEGNEIAREQLETLKKDKNTEILKELNQNSLLAAQLQMQALEEVRSSRRVQQDQLNLLRDRQVDNPNSPFITD